MWMQFSFDNVENISAYAFNLCFYHDLCRVIPKAPITEARGQGEISAYVFNTSFYHAFAEFIKSRITETWL